MKKANKKINLRRLKMGTYGIVITAIVIALVVFVNLIVSALPVNLIHFSTGNEDYFEVGETSEKILAALDTDVKLYLIAERGQEDTRIHELLKMYEAKCSKIDVEVIDPAVEPAFTSTYTDETLAANSIIAVSDKRSTVVPNSDMSGYYYQDTKLTYEQAYYLSQYGYETEARFDGEMAITSALEFVNADVLPTVYVLTGHGEAAFDTNYSAFIENENINVSSLKLSETEKIPEDCKLLCIMTPTDDISSAELETLENFSKQGGDILFVTNYTFDAEKLPNFAALAKEFGLEAMSGVVCDTVESTSSSQSSHMFYSEPVASENGITSREELADATFVVNAAHGIKISSVDGVTVTDILKTSDKAVMKNVTTDGKLEDNDDYKAGEPISIAVSAEHASTGERDNVSSFVWFSTTALTDYSVYQYYQETGNIQMLLATLAQYCEKSNTVSIIGKSLALDALSMTETWSNVLMIVMTVIIPIAIIGCGFAVWYRRRRR